MRSESFVDYVRIHVKAGDGGDGVVAFRREKYVPEGGPAGGHGGDGGGIYLEGEQELVTLLDLKLRPFIKAGRGEPGGNWNRAGASADNVIVKVPLGTTASGDARNALNALVLAVESTAPDKDGVI